MLVAVGICLERRYILLEDGRALKIVLMMDAEGDETENEEDCVGVVFERPDGKFSPQDIRAFDEDMIIKPLNS